MITAASQSKVFIIEKMYYDLLIRAILFIRNYHTLMKEGTLQNQPTPPRPLWARFPA
jgi:hypothetical protein